GHPRLHGGFQFGFSPESLPPSATLVQTRSNRFANDAEVLIACLSLGCPPTTSPLTWESRRTPSTHGSRIRRCQPTRSAGYGSSRPAMSTNGSVAAEQRLPTSRSRLNDPGTWSLANGMSDVGV